VLLLVLILVVIAFGLLVVALLSGSVLWAWVSVGVSVVAAVVLLVDWLQRRAAVKAGAAPAVEPAAGAPAPLASPPMGFPPGMGRPPMADMDPATEVLPVVPSSSRREDETVAAQAPKQPDARPSDAQQTVVMPAVQPSGSPARPSGADPTVTSSSAISSPTVTGGEADRSDPGFGTGDAEPPSAAVAGPATGAAAAAAAGAVAAGRKADDEPDEKSPSLHKAPSLTKEGPARDAGNDAEDGKTGDEPAGKAGDVVPAAGAGAPVSEPSAGSESAVAGSAAPGSAAPGSAAPGADAAAPVVSEPAATEAGTSPSGPDAESTVKVEAHTKAPAEPTVSAPAEPTVSAPAEDVDLFGAAPVRQPVEQAPAAQTPPAQTPAAQTPPAQTPPAQASVEEAPEEPRDPVAAEIVGKLDDEVVVVDEQPRYHVSECRALVAVAVIPLPVREAVELGFTPCGWCSPDRTLAGRHQTASR